MADDQGSSSGAQEPAEDIHNLASIINSTQSSIEQLFVSSRVPVEEEVKLRLEFAASQIQYGAFYQQASSLELAAEHLDTALRHMSDDSHQRPEALLLYCRVEFERHTLSRSRHALDMSVKYGREARVTATALRLLDNNTTLYIDILTELGHVLSHRNALLDNDDDLDESIACRRQILACTAADSEKHLLTLNNLASVLHRRCQDRGTDEDRDEAMNLLDRLLASTLPESQLYASGMTQLGFMAAGKYEKTGLLDDLDKAIQQLRTSETFVAEGIMQDGRDSLFQQLISLYERRHQHTFDVADKRQVVHYSNLAFNMLSPDHKLKPSRLYQLLMSSHQYTSMSDSTEVFETTMASCKEAMSTMPANFARREDFSAMYGKMLGRLYAATGKLEHLDDLMANVIIGAHQFGAMAVAGHTELDVPVQGGLLAVKCLLGLVRRLKSTPSDSPARQLAEEELHGVFLSTADYDDPEATGFRPTFLYQLVSYRTVILVRAAEDGILLSENQIQLMSENPSEELQRTTIPVAREDWEAKGLRGELSDHLNTAAKSIVRRSLIHALMGYHSSKSVSPAEFVAREERLEIEALELAVGAGMHPNHKLCRSCRTFLKFLHVTEDEIALDSSGSLFSFLGDWKVLLYCRDRCAMCQSLGALLATPAGELEEDLGKTDQHARALTGSCGRLPTGESFLRVMYGITPVGELLLATKDSFRGMLRQGWEIVDDGKPFPGIMADPNGPILREDGQLINPRQLQRWLKDCDYNHGRACNHPRPGDRIKADMPLICIDVVQDCLVDSTTRARYFALSYTWGRVDMHMTLRGNVDERRQPSGLAAIPFPKTIRDAMQLVRLMGERLLWIDAVCIVQDDLDQKARDIPRMDIVYGNAFLTIAALHGASADAGLPGIRPGSRRPQKLESLTITGRSPDLEHDPTSKDNEEVYIVPAPRPFFLKLRRSTWNTRGWILQEHILSRRCLYFTEDAVYFQCSKSTSSEKGVEQDLDTFFHGETVTCGLRQHNHTNPLALMNSWHDLGPASMIHQSFRAYMTLVELYTRRQFTQKSDIINGFMGVLAVFNEYWASFNTIDAATLHGIPQAVFVYSLLWSPADRIPRRGSRIMALDDPKYDPGCVDPAFPSWSWAGWDGPVDFRLFEWFTRPHERPLALVKTIELDGHDVFPCHGDLSHTVAVDKWNGTAEDDHDGSSSEASAPRDALPTEAGTSQNVGQPSGSKRAVGGVIVAEEAQSDDNNDTWVASRDVKIQESQRQENTGEESGKGKGKDTASDWVADLPTKMWCDPDTGKTWIFGSVATRPAQYGPPPASNILKMTAPAVSMKHFTIDPHKEYFSISDQPHAPGPQSVRRILDCDGAHCGLWWQQYHYQWVGTGLFRDEELELRMIGISKYLVELEPRRGFGGVGAAIPMFDGKIFKYNGDQGGLVNVLVIDDRDATKFGASCRCTVALIHPQAWQRAGPRQQVVCIA